MLRDRARVRTICNICRIGLTRSRSFGPRGPSPSIEWSSRSCQVFPKLELSLSRQANLSPLPKRLKCIVRSWELEAGSQNSSNFDLFHRISGAGSGGAAISAISCESSKFKVGYVRNCSDMFGYVRLCSDISEKSYSVSRAKYEKAGRSKVQGDPAASDFRLRVASVSNEANDGKRFDS